MNESGARRGARGSGEPAVGARPDWRRIYRIADWLWIALALQGLWILGTLSGGVLLGVGPASTAVAACWRSALAEQETTTEARAQVRGRWPEFWSVWRRTFWRSQLTVLIPALTLWPIVFWALAVRSLPVAIAVLAIGGGLLLTIFYLPVATALAPALTVLQTWRAGIALAWARPGPTIAIGLGVVVLAVVSVTVSAIVWPLFVPALPLLAAVRASLRTAESQAVDRDTPV